jgi:pyruvate-ferredoxin/flavodoxin oxidoreductase
MLVDSGAWPLYRFNPALIAEGKNPLAIDRADTGAGGLFQEFIKTEGRFNAANSVNKNFDKLVSHAVSDNEYRRELKKHIASFSLRRAALKEDGEG